MPFDLLSGKFVPEKSNIWRDCVDGQYDWVREHVLEGAPLNEADHCGDPPLLLAAGNGHKSCVALLLDEGAHIEQRNVVRYLLERGADVNAIDLVGGWVAGWLATPPHFLTPDCTIAKKGDNTALHWAAMRGHVEVVRCLLGAGADRAAVNAQGRTPMDLAQPQWSLAYKFVRAELAA
ncbi:hypothetical protein HYH02_013642 [Chlamydomonas schloesseri]|uniref:Flagellar associated protein n=1 Tax=Chlamydomonas schloesseri TaxID=2026947 RepID=A0A835SP80_9CHLO|nr:hypothetical protein HYH02_013642 [Chlamydomonas schloesseri]|eukprot:KAG2430644.1 hypothetical protein HYH02_013642 [Chlamydomonas schloesseri]